MRTLRLVPFLLLALAPVAPAETGGGNGLGAEVGPYAAGAWDVWRVYVDAPGTLAASLTWVASPGGADYDLTLWTPGADLDGRLAQSEMLKTSWTRSRTPGEALSHPVTLHAQGYVVTVESASAKLETYYLTVTGGDLVRTCHNVSQYTFGATCLWTAQGVKDRS